ncbi:hypothetical protein EJD97_025843, partial [Solanum chilense]
TLISPAKMDAAGKNGDDAMAHRFLRHRRDFLPCFDQFVLLSMPKNQKMLYWVLQLDSNGFYDADLVVI